MRRKRKCHYLNGYIEETTDTATTQTIREFPDDAKRTPEFWELEAELHNYLLDELKKYPGQSREQEQMKIEELAEAFFDQEGRRLTFEEKQDILHYVKDELLAYGPITPLLENPLVSEVMVNNYNEVYYEKNGKVFRSNVNFIDNLHVMRVIERIVSPIGRRIDESSPMVDARLPDGSRVNAIIPPLALKRTMFNDSEVLRYPFYDKRFNPFWNTK